MTILEYYKKQQQNSEWKQKFQSTSESKSGKTFAFVNTNFRKLSSFFEQTHRFAQSEGKDRRKWSVYVNSKQELDKHRIVNLKNANIIQYDDNCYLFTYIGYTIENLRKNSKLDDDEKWLLLYLLLLCYSTDKVKYEFFYSTKQCLDCIIGQCKIEENVLMEEILRAIKTETLSELFRCDAFWLVSFAKDDAFNKIYYSSNSLNKNQLFSYVISEQGKAKSSDLIGHKFASGGAYQRTTFIDELKILYLTNHILNLENMEFEDFILDIITCYNKISTIKSLNNIKEFITENEAVYKKIYDSIGGLR